MLNLNLPNCINCKSVPIKKALTAPYKDLNELSMTCQLHLQASNQLLQDIDLTTFSQSEIDENSCSIMKKEFADINKYCGLCHYNMLNVIKRIDAEVDLLSYVYSNGPIESIQKSIFKYYLIAANDDVINITSDIYSLLLENQSNIETTDAILLNYYQDDESLKQKSSIIANKVMNNKITLQDVEKRINELNKLSELPLKKEKYSNILNLINMSNNPISTKTKSTKKNTKVNKENKENSTDQIKLEERLNANNNTSSSEDLKEVIDKVEVVEIDTNLMTQTRESLSEVQIVEAKNEMDQETKLVKNEHTESAEVIDFNNLMSLCIAKQEVYISTKDNLELFIEQSSSMTLPYTIDTKDSEAIDFLTLLFMNRNIVKIVEDTKKLSSVIDLSEINSVFDVSILDKKGNDFIETYKKNITSMSVDLLREYKKKIQIKLIKTFNVQATSNVTFKLNGSEEVIDDILYTAYNKKVFEKFEVKYSLSTNNTLELFIEGSTKSVAVDYFLTCIRSVLKSNARECTFEVIMK